MIVLTTLLEVRSIFLLTRALFFACSAGVDRNRATLCALLNTLNDLENDIAQERIVTSKTTVQNEATMCNSSPTFSRIFA